MSRIHSVDPAPAGLRRATPRGDLVRQILVTVAVAAALAGGFVGSGALGGRSVQDTQGGALGPSGSLLAPAGPAFMIWTPLYAGLVAYVVWQLLPSQRHDPRHRAAGWWIAAIAVLEGAWILAAQLMPLWVTVAVMAGLVAVAYRAHRAAFESRRRASAIGAVLLDGLTGAHLGWATAAGVANAAAWIASLHLGGWAGDGAAVLALVLLCAAGIVVSARSAWSVAAPLAMAWGAAWIGVGRLAGEPESVPVGIVACAMAALLAAVTVGMRLTLLRTHRA